MDARSDRNEGKVGSCVSCGFLAKFISKEDVPPPRFLEATERERTTGRFERAAFFPYQGTPTTTPKCYRGEADFDKEFQEIDKSAFQSDLAYQAWPEIFKAKRDCPAWIKYMPGFSPMEHLQELKMLELEERRERFEQKLEKDRREFDERLDRRNRSFAKWTTIALLIFAALGLVTALIQLIYPEGWPLLMNYFNPPSLPSSSEPLNVPGGF